MLIHINFLQVFKEIAVANAMKTGAQAFGAYIEPGRMETVKRQLIKLVTAEVRENVIVLRLDSVASMSVAPLYVFFSAAWEVPQVCKATEQLLRKSSSLKDVQFELHMLCA